MITDQENYVVSCLIDIDQEINRSIVESLVVDAGVSLTRQLDQFPESWGTLPYSSDVEVTFNKLDCLKGKRIKLIDAYATGFDFYICREDG